MQAASILPAALQGTQTPNIMTNTQQSYTQELRWQSSDPTSKWTWTAGIFLQLAKEGSIEELRSTNIDQVFNYLFGFSPSAYYAGNFYSCRRTLPIRERVLTRRGGDLSVKCCVVVVVDVRRPGLDGLGNVRRTRVEVTA